MPSLSLVAASKATYQQQAKSSNNIDEGQFKTPTLDPDGYIGRGVDNMNFATSTFEEEGVKFAHATNEGHISFK